VIESGTHRSTNEEGNGAAVVSSPPACTERSSLMNVGRRVDYAIRALAYLAGQDPERLVRRSEIESKQGIPRHFLSKILRALVGAGFLESVAGARGGFRLRKAPSEITFLQVYECFEGELCLIECLRDGATACNFTSVCTQINVWRMARQKLFEYLDSVSIAEVADRDGLGCRLARDEALAEQKPLA
jgi:Rrf2 family protein